MKCASLLFLFTVTGTIECFAPVRLGILPMSPSSFCSSTRGSSADPVELDSAAAVPSDNPHAYKTTSDSSSTHSMLNVQLERLARRCSDHDNRKREDVISVAAKAEDIIKNAHPDQKNVESYNAIMRAWANVGGTLAEGRGREKISSSLLTVNVYTSRDAAMRATEILHDMETKYALAVKKEGEQNVDDNLHIKPNCHSYHTAIGAWSHSKEKDAGVYAEAILRRMESNNVVDNMAFHGCLECWAQDRTERGILKALALSKEMKQIADDNPKGKVKPNIFTTNCLIHVHAKADFEDKEERKRVAAFCDDLLKKQWNTYEETGINMPDVTTYTGVMEAYSKVGSLEATQRVEQLCEELEAKYEETQETRLRPNYKMYTSVISAWAASKDKRAGARAEEILKRMERLAARDDSVYHTKPNTRTYANVIKCWTRAEDSTKAKHVLRILKHMRERAKNGEADARPNLYAYNQAIDACAFNGGTSEEQAEALKIAFAILKTISVDGYEEPNSVTYSTLLKATSNLMPPSPDRNKVATAVFEKCKAGGWVDAPVMKFLRMALDSAAQTVMFKEYAEPNGYINYERFPHEWKRSVDWEK